LLRLSAHHLALAALASQPPKSGTLSLYLSIPIPVLTPSVVISRPTTASRPSTPLNPSPLAPQFRLCWPLCAFMNYIYLLTYLLTYLNRLRVSCFVGKYRAGQKGLFLRADNFPTTSGRKVWMWMSLISEFCREKCKTSMSVNLNIPWIVCILFTGLTRQLSKTVRIFGMHLYCDRFCVFHFAYMTSVCCELVVDLLNNLSRNKSTANVHLVRAVSALLAGNVPSSCPQ